MSSHPCGKCGGDCAENDCWQDTQDPVVIAQLLEELAEHSHPVTAGYLLKAAGLLRGLGRCGVCDAPCPPDRCLSEVGEGLEPEPTCASCAPDLSEVREPDAWLLEADDHIPVGVSWKRASFKSDADLEGSRFRVVDLYRRPPADGLVVERVDCLDVWHTKMGGPMEPVACPTCGSSSKAPTQRGADNSEPWPSTKDELAMATGCLVLVRETLENLLGEGSMDATPPMMYPEAIQSACARAAKIAVATGNPTPPLPLGASDNLVGEDGEPGSIRYRCDSSGYEFTVHSHHTGPTLCPWHGGRSDCLRGAEDQSRS